MKIFKLFFITSLCLFIAISCNKEKIFSNKLIKGETWVVKDISVNSSGLGYFGNWKIISDGSIYDSVPSTTWTFDNKNAVFEWQFQEKGKKFQLNYQQLCLECDGDELSELDAVCYNLTGNYDVIRHHKNKMEFHTENAIGYPNKKVRIVIERKK